MSTPGTLAAALAEAALLVAGVAAGRSLAGEALAPAVLDLTHGTLRRYGRLPALVQALSRRGRPDPLVEALLWCALYALESSRYADYAVVDQAVRACRMLERWNVKDYVNALLRNYLRNRAALETRITREREARWQHPAWWLDILRDAYPRDWEAIAHAGNTHPPMCLRVNRRKTGVAEYAAKLAAQGIAARAVAPEALLLERPLPVARVPGFEAGEVSVQDAGAQRAARCLDLAQGQRVLDACAAPGGKSGHILELADVALTALDIDAQRAARIGRNLERLGLPPARVVSGDACEPTPWWDGAAYDRILADVPCSASGIARRRPDAKWLRRARDVPAFAERQARLLGALWQLLAPGGKLLYATCSVFPQENDAVVDAFVAAHRGARRLALPDGGAAQWLPDAQHDGFHYSLIEKPA
jgi:16S rRNA (cytosine967-C5)-methyltransferase